MVKATFTIEREAFEQFNLEDERPPTTRAPAALKEKMLPRLLGGLVFHLDANLINARQKQDPVNRMERWRVLLMKRRRPEPTGIKDPVRYESLAKQHGQS